MPLAVAQRFMADVSCVLTHDRAICDHMWRLPCEAKWQTFPHLLLEDEELREFCELVEVSYDDVLAVPKHRLVDEDGVQPLMLLYSGD